MSKSFAAEHVSLAFATFALLRYSSSGIVLVVAIVICVVIVVVAVGSDRMVWRAV